MGGRSKTLCQSSREAAHAPCEKMSARLCQDKGVHPLDAGAPGARRTIVSTRFPYMRAHPLAPLERPHFAQACVFIKNTQQLAYGGALWSYLKTKEPTCFYATCTLACAGES